MALSGTVGTNYTGTLAVASAGGPVLPEQAGNFVQVVRLHWRILHPVSGQVLIDPLPHLHQSSYKVIYTQPGQPFDSAIGDFEIPLIPPDDDVHYAWAKPFYDQLAVYQRVEAYLIEEDGQGAQGDPVFTGVITKLPQSLQDYKIQGKDTMFLLTMAHTHRADVFQGTTNQLFTYALQAYSKTYGDNLTGTGSPPISLIQSAANYNSASTSATVSFAATTASSCLVAYIGSDLSRVTSAPAGWVSVWNSIHQDFPNGIFNPPVQASCVAWIYPNNPGGITSVTFTMDNNETHYVNFSEWRNVATVLPLDTWTAFVDTGQIQGTTITMSMGPVAGQGELALVGVTQEVATASTGNLTYPTGWTGLGDDWSTSDITHTGVAYLINPASGSSPSATFTTSTYGDEAAGVILFLKPASPGGTQGVFPASYVNNGNWTSTTDDGLTAIKAGGAGDGLLYTLSTYPNSAYGDCEISAPFHLIANTQSSISNGTAVEAGLIAAVQDANNLVLARIELYYVNPTTYNVKAQIWNKVAGVYTNRASVDGQLASPFNYYRPFLQLFGKQLNPSQYQWRLVVDGTDLNCTWVQPVVLGSPTGGVGLRSVGGISTGGQVYVHGGLSGFAFLGKQYIFQPGNVGRSSSILNQPIPVTKLSSLIDMALTQDQWGLLKHCKAGINNDVLDFNVSPAGDNSALVRFEEGDDIISFSQEANAELPATSIILSGSPDSSGQSIIKWYNLAAMDTYGLVEDLTSATTAVDDSAIRKAANAILSLKTKPVVAKRVTVQRKKKHSPSSSSPSGLRWREGHLITLHVPRQGIYDLKTQIIGFEMIEGEQSNEILMEQYPQHLDTISAIHRLRKEMRHEFLRSSDVTGNMMDGTGVIADRRLAVTMSPFLCSYMNNAAQLINTGTITRVNLQTVIFDPNGNFDIVNSTFVTPIYGYYLIQGLVSWDAAAAGRYLTLIYKNDGVAGGGEIPQARGSGQFNVGVVNVPSAAIVVALNPGDLITLKAFQNSVAARNVVFNGGDVASLTVTFLHQ